MHLHGLPLILLLGLLGALAVAGLTLLSARLSHPRPAGPFAPSHALPPPAGSRLAAAFAPRLAAEPGLTAVHLLLDPLDALAARLELIEAAESSVDLQYYIWQDDTAGALMLGALRRAAARGVRVRMLIDDNGTHGLDETLSTLESLENFDIRLFNPFPLRRARWLGYLADFHRLNRRMHNKAMVVDGALAVLGGRNIGDEYFNRFAPTGLYMDLDLMAAGPIVPQVAAQFDLYWNSALSIPVAALLAPLTPDRAEACLAAQAARLATPEARDYARALAAPDMPLLSPDLTLSFGPATLLFDPPEKITGPIAARRMLWARLLRALGQPREELVLISPYLVPTRAGVRVLGRYAKAGVKVRLFTNSFAASDVPLVHSGYAHRRRPLLKRGVEIWEFAPDAEIRHPPASFLRPRLRGTAPFARNKLHAKVFITDRARIFIGSFNFDPRSMRLNTELGLVLENPVIAAKMASAFEGYIPARAWALKLDREGKITWCRAGEAPTRREPGTGFWSGVALGLAKRLPIEWML